MRGGVSIYRGSAAAARNYVEADRSRADDYYLAEGTGVAERYLATPSTLIAEQAMMATPTSDGWLDTTSTPVRRRADS